MKKLLLFLFLIFSLTSFGQSISNELSTSNNGYLIVTTPTFQQAGQRLCNWKRFMGYQTFLETFTDPSTNTIKQVISNYYKNKKVRYLLIIGDDGDIPSMQYGSFLSDGSYCMIDNDDIPDLYYGRISPTDSKNALQIVDNIINYERLPVNNAEFWKKSMHTVYYDNSYPFVETSEDMYKYAKNNGLEPSRIYACDTGDAPKSTFGVYSVPNNSWYSAPGARNPLYQSINTGVNIWTHVGHGEFNKLSDLLNADEVNDELNDKNDIQNDNKAKKCIVFACACNTANFGKSLWQFKSNEMCIAEALQRKGIAVAYIGFSGNTNINPSSILFKSMFETLPNNPDNQDYKFRLGYIINNSMRQMYNECKIIEKKECIRYLQLMGDPTTMIVTKQPTKFKNYTISISGSKVTVQLYNGEYGQISLVNTQTKEVFTKQGHVAEFTVNQLCEYKVCVSGHNHIPVMKSIDLTPTNISSINVDNYKGAMKIDYKVNDQATSANIKVYKVPNEVCQTNSPIKNEQLNLSNGYTSSCSINFDLWSNGMYYVGVYEGTLFKDYEIVDCNPVGPQPNILIESDNGTTIKGRFKLGYGTNFSYGTIRFFHKSTLATTPGYVLGTESKSYRSSVNYYLHENDGTFIINYDKLPSGDYKLALYGDNSSLQYICDWKCNPGETTSIDNGSSSSVTQTKSGITSLAFDKSNQIIKVNYTLTNAISAKIILLNTADGSIVKAESLNVSSNTSYANINTSSLNAGTYVVILSVNGSHCDDKRVEVVKIIGGIQNFSYNTGNKTITVDYNTQNVSNSSIRIFKSGTSTLVKKISIPNSDSSNRYTIDISSLPAGTTYDVKLYGEEKFLDKRTFATPPDNTTSGTTVSPTKSSITSLAFEKSNQRIKVNYTLANATSAKLTMMNTSNGSIVKTEYLNVSTPTSYSYISTSSLNAGTYVVVLYVNNSSVDGKTITVTK